MRIGEIYTNFRYNHSDCEIEITKIQHNCITTNLIQNDKIIRWDYLFYPIEFKGFYKLKNIKKRGHLLTSVFR